MTSAFNDDDSWKSPRPTSHRGRHWFHVFTNGAIAVLMVVLVGIVPIAAQSPGAQLDAASNWLLSQRDESGAFPGFDGTADPGVTVDAVTALAMAGRARELETSLAYLEAEALVYAQTGPGSAAKLALMLIAAGQNPRDFATVDPLSIVEHAAAAGMIGFGPYDHAIGLLALSAAGSSIPDAAIEAAWSAQGEEDAWAFDGSTAVGSADTNTTAMMIRALGAAGHGDDDRVEAAAVWLAGLLGQDGMPYQAGGPADSNSTALAVRAFEALRSESSVVIGYESIVNALIDFQNGNGSFSWMLDPRDDNIFSTVEAIPALAAVADISGVPTGSPLASPQASPVALKPAA